MAHKQILTHMFPTKVSFLSSFYEHVAIKRYMAPVHEMNQTNTNSKHHLMLKTELNMNNLKTTSLFV